MEREEPEQLKRWIKEQARAAGFTLAGVAPAGGWPSAHRLEPWLAAGRHGTMHWLARRPAERADPRLRLHWARSALLVALHYRTGDPCPPAAARPISRYAWGTDYHRVMRAMLRQLAAQLHAQLPELRSYWFVDTSPVLERAAAGAAGIGWLGKNTMLIHEREGSFLFLGGLLLSVELPPDRPAPGRCGRCTRCLQACPTRAFLAPYLLDARRCISYLTIELRGPIPRELRPLMGTLVFGCDICQEVCPWNQRAWRREAVVHGGPFAARPGLVVCDRALLEELLLQDEERFRARFRASPIRRARRAGLARNAAVALGNLGDAAAVPALVRAARTDPEALVRGHACWALGRLLARGAGEHAAPAHTALVQARTDPDPSVRAEAEAALAEAQAPVQPAAPAGPPPLPAARRLPVL